MSKRKAHLHVVGEIHLRGKPDSVYVTCVYCGEMECFASWWDGPPPGWDARQYPELQDAIAKFLEPFRSNRIDLRDGPGWDDDNQAKEEEMKFTEDEYRKFLKTKAEWEERAIELAQAAGHVHPEYNVTLDHDFVAVEFVNRYGERIGEYGEFSIDTSTLFMRPDQRLIAAEKIKNKMKALQDELSVLESQE